MLIPKSENGRDEKIKEGSRFPPMRDEPSDVSPNLDTR